MSPVHHHFELLGWSETQIVARFWIVHGIRLTVLATLIMWILLNETGRIAMNARYPLLDGKRVTVIGAGVSGQGLASLAASPWEARFLSPTSALPGEVRLPNPWYRDGGEGRGADLRDRHGDTELRHFTPCAGCRGGPAERASSVGELTLALSALGL